MGLLLLWKPQGPGSQHQLGHLKRSLNIGGRDRSGIGHTGTLDPFAEGWLLVGIGEGTKLLTPMMGLPKTYEARLIFGVTSDSLDETGTLDSSQVASVSERLPGLNDDKLREFLKSHLGAFDQMPPQFSAIHVDGKRAYEWAREGVTKALKSRRCEILESEHISFSRTEWRGHPVGEWNFRVKVSSGTYIRALARDWAQELVGAPGLLSRLVRTQVGPFTGNPAEEQHWLGASDLAPLFDIESIDASTSEQIRHFGRWTPRPRGNKPALLMSPDGEAVAWTEAGTGALGRVFLQNPLKAEKTEEKVH